MTSPAPATIDGELVLRILDSIPDPEIPAVSIVQLGMIGKVAAGPGGIRVELLPTFVGCPALELIRAAVGERLAELGVPVEVEVSFSTPWTSDRISPQGREALRRSGFAPPPHLRTAPGGRALPMLDPETAGIQSRPCPYCGSSRTSLVSVFGPTQCRTVHQCTDCRQPFEGFKPI